MWKVLKVHLALLIVNLIYGSNYVVAKEVMPTYIQPFGFIILRVWVAGLLIVGVHSAFVKGKVDRQDWPRLIGCGVFGVAVNQLMFFKGLNLTTPINAALVMLVVPGLVLFFSSLFLKERATVLKLLGILLGGFGAFLIIFWGKELSMDSDSFLGDLFVFVNATSYAIYLVMVKPLMKKYHPYTVLMWVFVFGAIMVLPFGYGELMEVQWSTIPSHIWAAIGFVVILTTFVAYSLNIFALRTVNPSVVSIYIYLQPLVATLAALSFGKDEITPIKMVAAVLIFIGVYLVSKPTKKAQVVQ